MLPFFASVCSVSWNCLSTTVQSLPISCAPVQALLSSLHNALQILERFFTLSEPCTLLPHPQAATCCLPCGCFSTRDAPWQSAHLCEWYGLLSQVDSIPIIPENMFGSDLTHLNSSDLRKSWEQCPAPITETRVWLRSVPGHPCWAYCPVEDSWGWPQFSSGASSDFVSITEVKSRLQHSTGHVTPSLPPQVAC